jgi:hypothetical protein
MGARVGRRANFGRVLIHGGASPARGCGQAGARRWAASGRDPGTRKAGLSSQISLNNSVTLIVLWTLALEPACPLFVVVVVSTRLPAEGDEPGLLGPGQAAPSRGLPFRPPTLRSGQTRGGGGLGQNTMAEARAARVAFRLIVVLNGSTTTPRPRSRRRSKA